MTNTKTMIVAVLLTTAFMSGIARQITEPGQFLAQSDIPFMIIGIVLVFSWFRADANQRNFKRSPVLNVAVVALAILALPYYFFRSRGFVGGFAATVAFVCFGVLYNALQYAGSYAVYVSS